MIKKNLIYYSSLFVVETLVITLIEEVFKVFVYNNKDLWTVSHAFQDAMTWAILRFVYMFIISFTLFVFFNKTIHMKNPVLKVTIINSVIYFVLCLFFSFIIPSARRFYDLKFGFFYYTIFAILVSPLLLAFIKLKPPTFAVTNSNL